MFTCYIEPDEFYAAMDIEHWVPRATLPARLRNATIQVGNDFRARGIDIARLHVPVMFTGSLYEYITTTTNSTSDAITAGNASRLVVECSASDYTQTFYVEGSMDNSSWRRIHSVTDGLPMALAIPGTGIYSMRFYEKYRYYRLCAEVEDSVTYTAYLVDSAPDELIIWKTIENAMYVVLDADTRTQELYTAAVQRYSALLADFRSDYDADGDNTVDASEQNMKQQTLLYR